MSATSLFRTILIAGLVFAIIGVIAGSSLSDTLPPTLQNYLAQIESEDISNSKDIFYILGFLIILILLPISIIGLWKFKSWARTMYLIISVGFIPFYPIIGPVVMNGWEAMFNDIALMLDGVLLTVMFTGETSQKFKATKIESDS
jgi:uncharacterized membrane protein